jgi:Tfp pilus assembly protein PilV
MTLGEVILSVAVFSIGMAGFWNLLQATIKAESHLERRIEARHFAETLATEMRLSSPKAVLAQYESTRKEAEGGSTQHLILLPASGNAEVETTGNLTHVALVEESTKGEGAAAMSAISIKVWSYQPVGGEDAKLTIPEATPLVEVSFALSAEKSAQYAPTTKQESETVK